MIRKPSNSSEEAYYAALVVIKWSIMNLNSYVQQKVMLLLQQHYKNRSTKRE